MRVLTGQNRKASLFVPVVEGTKCVFIRCLSAFSHVVPAVAEVVFFRDSGIIRKRETKKKNYGSFTLSDEGKSALAFPV
jgi:hypothetical protein